MSEKYRIEVEGPTLMPTGKWSVLVTVEGSGTKVVQFDSAIKAKAFMDELSRDLLSRGASR